MQFTYIGNQGSKDVRLASSTANGAFVTANSASTFANGAFVAANSGFSFANAAFAQANAAFAAANTGGGGGTLTGYVDVFTGDGSNSSFTLSTTPSNKNITFVAVQGVLQPKASYNISGTALTFDSTPPNTAYIEVTTLVGSGGAGGSSMTWYIANANTTMAASSGYFVNTAIGKKTGVAIRRIILKNLKEISVPLPSLLIQKKIVSILDAIFAEIDKATAAAEANANNAEALFQSYLTEVFEHGGKGWLDKIINDVCSNITDGKHGDCANQENSGYYFLSAKDIKNGILNYTNARQITKNDFNEFSLNYICLNYI